MPTKTEKLKNKPFYPRITIITPSYNQGEYIEQTIKSVIGQNYPNLEYLIFDGGSTDKTISILKKYSRLYPQIKWVSKPDRGQVDVINKGLTQATGEIIAYINSDDYYSPEILFEVSKSFQSHHWLWLVGNCKVTSPKLTWSFFLKHIWPIDRNKVFLQVFNTINQPSVFLTKTLVGKTGLFNDKYHYAFDYDYWLRAINFSLPFRLNKTIATFRVHNNSKGNTGFVKQFAEDMEICRKHSTSKLAVVLHWLGWKTTLALYTILK